MINPVRISVFLFLVLILGSCSWIRSLTEKEADPVVTPEEEKTPEELFNLLKAANFSSDWVKADTRARVRTPDMRTSASLRLVMAHDSIIWGSISPAFGIEIARFTISPDSIRIINRYDRTYRSLPFSVIHQYTGSRDLEFSNLQDLLIGNFPFDFSADMQSRVDSHFHVLYTKSPDESTTINIYPENFKPAGYLINRPERNQNLNLTYKDYKSVDGKIVPEKLLIQAALPARYEVEITFQSITFEAEQNLRFDVPDNYERVR